MHKIVIAILITFSLPSAFAEGGDRFLLGGGLIHLSKPSKTYFEIGAEYEHRLSQVWGLGGQGNYIFSNPGLTLLALPTVFIHPTQAVLLNVSPLFQFGAKDGNHAGARFGARVHIPIGSVALIPAIGVDLINGSTNLLFGLGLQL